jgi:hypothetical protein
MKKISIGQQIRKIKKHIKYCKYKLSKLNPIKTGKKPGYFVNQLFYAELKLSKLKKL